MNEANLKRSLRQLSKEGWIITEAPDDLLDILLARAEGPPSDEIKERFLLRFRATIQDAMQQQAKYTGELKHELSDELDPKSPRQRHSRKLQSRKVEE
ncbi:MAG: hypothetical protein WCA37_00105 [Terracidiphilus sp.]